MDKKTRFELGRLRDLVANGAEAVNETTKRFSDEERLDLLFSHVNDLRIVQGELDRILDSGTRCEAPESDPLPGGLKFSDDELRDLSSAVSMEIVAVLDPIRKGDWMPDGDVSQRLKRANQLQELKGRIDESRGGGA